MRGKKGLFILLGVLVVLVAALLMVNYLGAKDDSTADQTTETADSGTEASSLVLLEASTDDLWALSWENEVWSMELTKAGDWVWAAAQDQALDQEAVAALAESLCSLTASRLVTEDTALLSEFSLDDPVCTIRFSVLDTDCELALGLYNSAYGQYYALWQGKVYLLETDLSGFLSSPYTLLSAEALPDITASDVTDFSVVSSDSTLTLCKPEDPENYSYSNSYTWFLQQDDTYTALSTTAANSLVNQVLNLDLSDCLGCQADGSAGDLSDYDCCVTLSYSDAEADTAGTLTLYCQVPDTEAALVGGEELTEAEETEEEPVRVWLEGSGLVYGVAQSSLSKVLDPDPDSLLPQDVCAVDFDDLRTMVLTLDGVEYRFVMTPGEDDTVSYTLNGVTVDETMASSVFSSVKNLSVEDTTENANAGGEPVLTLKLYRDRETYAQMTLSLLPYDASFYVVDFAGQQRLLVSLRDVEELLQTLRDTLN